MKYIILFVIAFTIGSGVYVGWHAVKTVEHIKTMQKNVDDHAPEAARNYTL